MKILKDFLEESVNNIFSEAEMPVKQNKNEIRDKNELTEAPNKITFYFSKMPESIMNANGFGIWGDDEIINDVVIETGTEKMSLSFKKFKDMLGDLKKSPKSGDFTKPTKIAMKFPRHREIVSEQPFNSFIFSKEAPEQLKLRQKNKKIK